MHPSGVAKSSTSFGWGKGWKVTAAGWQVTLCDPTWHVISRSGVVKFTNCCTLFTLLLLLLHNAAAAAGRGVVSHCRFGIYGKQCTAG